MDLPPDKARVLKGYDDDKKWDLVCDQVPVWFKLFIIHIKCEIQFYEILNFMIGSLFTFGEIANSLQKY